MTFNALISNTDDHLRNHAIIAKKRDWKLSPAYDLTPTPSISLERRDLALDAGDAGRYANVYNLLSQSLRFLVKREDAERLIDDMEQRIKKTWYEVCRKEGVSERDCESISGAFVYPGFRIVL
jgi:serine/threonine-protein kinase HipA